MYIFQFPLILKLLLCYILMLKYSNIQIALSRPWYFMSALYVIVLLQWNLLDLFENSNGTFTSTVTVTFMYLYIFIHQTRHEFSDGSVCWNISRVMILIPGGSSVCPPSLCYNARSLNIVLSGFIGSIAITFSEITSNVDQS